ncbi:hypothetical protein [Vallicoccus soli]|uniref:hypothetical protein n=1 Tax=Vallicoccus soli TaxID=2339232 RepID=UPI001403955C|nr:hypothetical protein [Vallicoccus soli]
MQDPQHPDPEIVAAVERIRSRFGSSGLRVAATLMTAEAERTERELQAAFAEPGE